MGRPVKSLSGTSGDKGLASKHTGRPVGAPHPVDRWISFELGRLNAGLVVDKKSLAGLLTEDRPACRTREGDEHPFDREILERYAACLSPHEAEGLRLPITLLVSGDLENSAYLTDEVGSRAIRAIEGFGSAFAYGDGRMILPNALALDVVRRHGGAIQLVFA